MGRILPMKTALQIILQIADEVNGRAKASNLEKKMFILN